MLPIYNNEPNIVYCNEDIIIKHKDICDIYLINIHSELTKSLINYKLFILLQDVNNTFYYMLENLYNHEYDYYKEAINDKDQFEKSIDVFLKACENDCSISSYNTINDILNKIIKSVNHLYYILDILNKQ